MMRLLIPIIFIAASLSAATSEIADAAENRDLAGVRAAIAQHASVTAAQLDGTTALHWAAHWNETEAFNLLLRAGADAKAVNRYGATPLSEAAMVGNARMVEALLKAGADPNTLTTPDGETVLMTAARAGQLDAVMALAGHGAGVNARETYRGQTALMWAAAEHHPEVVKYLLEHGADWKVRSFDRNNQIPKLSAASSITPMAKGGLTALDFAAREGDVESARGLLDAGADINQLDADNTHALTIALVNKHYTFTRFLLDRGASPNLADSHGRTPLYAAIDARNEDYSALPTRKEDDPLPSIEIIRALLDHGADRNAALTRNLPGRSGMDSGDTTLDAGTTPLMRAARAGDVEVMRLLIQKGADPKRTTGSGNDILLYAAGVGYRDKNTRSGEEGALESVKVALGQGLDLHHQNARGETAMHGAAFRGADNVVEYLASQGGRLDEKTKQGFTVLDYAMGRSISGQLPVPHDSTVVLLRKLGAHEGREVSQAVASAH